MENAKKYSSKNYKRDNIIHQTYYYEVSIDNIFVQSSTDRAFIYSWLSWKKKTEPNHKYKLYKHITQRIKHTPNEKLN